MNIRRLLPFTLVVFGIFLVSAPIFAQEDADPAYVILITPIEADPALTQLVSPINDSMTAELGFQGQLHAQFALIKTSSGLGRPPSQANLTAADAERNSRFVIVPSLFSDGPDTILSLDVFEWGQREQIFTQEMVFQDISDVLSNMGFFCWSLSSNLPPAELDLEGDDVIYVQRAEDIAWKNKWLYLSPLLGGSVRLYQSTDNGPNTVGISYDFGLRAELQFVTFIPQTGFFSFSLLTGASFTFDQTDYTEYTLKGDPSSPILIDQVNPFEKIGISNDALHSFYFPLALKFNYKPGKLSMSLYGGMYYVVPVGAEYTLPLGIIGGFNFGGRVGPGVLYLDTFIGTELGRKIIGTSDTGAGNASYTRSMFTLAVGYGFGIIDRKPKERKPAAGEK
jgi:hypothetical protein